MTNDLKKVVAATVRAARDRLEITQEELASRIGKTPESISNIERALQLPSLDTLADLARTLGIPIGDFLEANAPRTQGARLKLEARLREIVRELSDRELRILLRQADALRLEK